MEECLVFLDGIGDFGRNGVDGDLRVGELIVVHAGEMIPADGTIVAGMASIDQRRLTGESIL